MAVYNIKGTEKMPVWKLILIVIVAIAFAPITIFLIHPLLKLKDYCKAKDYKVEVLPEEYKDKTKLIAHRGFRALAPENTLPAFEKAGEASFWGCENDIHRTKDGVWVVHHDSRTFRMMNKNTIIEKTNFADLQKLYVDNGSNFRDYKNLRITTLEEYLKVCAEYNMVAVMELKGRLNTEYYDEIVALVEKYQVKPIYISFEDNAILAMRKLTDAPLYYIVYKITQEAVDFAKSVENCGIDFDGNDDFNKKKESVAMIHNAGLSSCLWAIDDVNLVKHYVDLGVEYITTNAVKYN